jgi:hypothetical protein
LFSYQVHVTATSTADARVSGSTIVTVPRIDVDMIPAKLESTLPGSLFPFKITVKNAHDASFNLFVDGNPGGNATVGTFTQATDTTATYAAPTTEPWTILHEPFANSAEDPARFASSRVTVRKGYPVLADANQSQFSPEWGPSTNLLAYVEGGPPWRLYVHDLNGDVRTPIADVQWMETTYHGRVSWNGTGDRLAFSEEVMGRRVIGLVDGVGTNRQTLSPDPSSEYLEAAFYPTASAVPGSVLVSVQTGGASELRVYEASGAESGPGDLLYTAPPGWSVRWPDAVRISDDVWVAASQEEGGMSQVIAFVDDDSGDPPRIPAGGIGKRTHTSWAIQQGIRWINFLWDGTQNAYRVNHTGSRGPMRLYTDLFPEQSADVSIFPNDLHAISRLEDSGFHHIWVVEYPAYDFLGVTKAEEIELERLGITTALSPDAWRRWLGDSPRGVRRTAP